MQTNKQTNEKANPPTNPPNKQTKRGGRGGAFLSERVVSDRNGFPDSVVSAGRVNSIKRRLDSRWTCEEAVAYTNQTLNTEQAHTQPEAFVNEHTSRFPSS